jgi:hypothetical protein
MLMRRLVVAIRVSVPVHCPPAKRSVPPPTAPLQAVAPSGGACQAVGEGTHTHAPWRSTGGGHDAALEKAVWLTHNDRTGQWFN